MVDLYTWRTPNGRKPAILLAELDWPCALHLVDLGRNEQKAPAYLAKNPNGKIRLAGVLDGRLQGREWIARAYSIADVINYPWFAAMAEAHPELLDGARGVRAWMTRMEARPAVRKGMALEVGGQ